VAKVLAVDDEPQFLHALGRGLTRVGHEVLVARTAKEGLVAAASVTPDVVLLDLRLPDLDGIEVVRRLRSWTDVPILLLSGDGTERVRVAALDAGADDFVDKPFSMEELRARVGATLRRSAARQPAAAPDGSDAPTASEPDGHGHATLVAAGVSIDVAAREVRVDDEPVRLTPTEWRLLEVLVANPGQLLSYQRIITEVWTANHGDEARDSLRVHLRSLRRKLGDDAASPRFVRTEPGIGCRWVGGHPA
jgi:two-component system, OmpR family, KDP operon response regulator KdpE